MTPRGGLPDITFADTSSTNIVTNAVSVFEKLTGETLAPADPRRVFIQALCTIIAQQRQLIDYSAKQNLLTYSEGDALDHMGYLMSVERLDAQAALTTLRFALSAIQSGIYIIPAGTQVTTSTIIFLTQESLEIPAGSLTGDVIAYAAEPGEKGNGFLPGQVNAMVTPLPFIASVTNLTETTSGADIESDENYAERIHLAPDSFSSAGPEAAYIYWTRTANQNIKSVSVVSPTPGLVEVRPLLANGDLPSEELLAQVAEVLSATTVRPLTDRVSVLVPTGIDYELNAKYWISTTDKNKASAIQTAATAALNEYLIWQRSEQGRDINPDELTAKLKAAGVKRVEISSPVFTVVGRTEVARETSVSCTYQGLEDG
ncbi:baseplate assembly protein [Citrobacter amalonaticus]|uniref:baseplate assembly protein n=1 Tax=Citrobacter amalonaticus TaxID=35703 RepID=UPI000A3C06F9|nr:baseplate J/gp47 family protein [Citrobacter amalonaticus]OUE50273.1 hypothetical protein AZ012_004666 [Citrobacter amalonaticus]